MGSVCSAGIPRDRSLTELSLRAMGIVVEQKFKAFSVAGKVQGKNKTASVEEAAGPDRLSDQSFRFSEKSARSATGGQARRSVSKESHLVCASSERQKARKSRPSTSGKAAASKVSDKGSLLGRVSTSGLEKAVEVLDTLSSSMSSLSPGGGFVLRVTTKENKVSILVFEVANTVVKGMSLMKSLSKENLKYLWETIF